MNKNTFCIVALLIAVNLQLNAQQEQKIRVELEFVDNSYDGYQEFSKTASLYLEKVLNSDIFREYLSNLKMKKKRWKSNLEIYDLIMKGHEKQCLERISFEEAVNERCPKKNINKKYKCSIREKGIINLKVRTINECDGSDWLNKNCKLDSKMKTIGIDGNGDGVTAICPQRLEKWLKDGRIDSLAGHYMHEYMHILGFSHKFPLWKYKSAVYKIGNLVTQLVARELWIKDDLNLVNFNTDFSDYNQKTSVYCAQISKIVYWDSLGIANLHKQVSEKYPNANYRYKFIDHKDKKSDTQALLWGNSDFLVIAFRGTEGRKLKDWITNIKFCNYKSNQDADEEIRNIPAGHGGFRRSLMNLITKQNLFEKIDAFIKNGNPNADVSKTPIYLTGHSLGAAISQLFIEPLELHTKSKYNFSGAYHFAPPLAVSCEVNEQMKNTYGDKVYDIVNYKDYVPRAGRNGVAHFGKFYRICKDGLMYKEKESYIKFKLFEYRRGHESHFLSNHLIALKDQKNTIKGINDRSIIGEEYPCLKPKKEIRNCE